MNQLSHVHSILRMNGQKVEGLADDDVPIELPDIDLAEITFGKDGAMYSNGTGRRGGEVMVKLLPTSVTAKEWLRDHAQIQNGTVLTYEGIWEDANLNYSTVLRGGVLTKAPAGIHPGKNVEFTFTFEETVPQMDAAAFARSPF